MDKVLQGPHSHTERRLALTLSKLANIFGPEAMAYDIDKRKRYGYAINGSEVWPAIVVWPRRKTELQSLLNVARSEGLHLHPVSRGKNYGYGTAQGTSAGQVIVDLSRMDKVIAVHEELGYAVLQPGVSQQQLYDHLKASGSRLQMDVTGAGGKVSIVGNVLERGFGHTDYGDRFGQVLSLEVVLPCGQIVRTGFGDYPGAQASAAYRHGMGPSVDGLFSQSNLGIVTEMTLALQPKPEHFCMFAYFARQDMALEGLIDTVRELKLAGALQSTVHIANQARLQKPGKENKAGAWNVSGMISGPRALGQAKAKAVKKQFKRLPGQGKFYHITDAMLRAMSWVHRYITPLSLYQDLEEATKLKKGIPTERYIQDLAGDEGANSANLPLRMGRKKWVKWISAVSPALPHKVREMVGLVEKMIEQEGYTFRCTLTFINSRSVIMIADIAYSGPSTCLREAEEVYVSCVERLKAAGYYAYRSGSGSYELALPANYPLQDVLRAIKGVVDPQGVLSPGKYGL